MITTKTTLFTGIENAIKSLNIDSITKERKTILQSLTEFVQSKVSNHQEIRINFICTHNSRRSHLTQVWTQTLAYHFNIKMCSVIQVAQNQQLCFLWLQKH